MVGGKTLGGFIYTKKCMQRNYKLRVNTIRVHTVLSNHLISAIHLCLCVRIVCASVARRTLHTALRASVRLCTSVQ